MISIQSAARWLSVTNAFANALFFLPIVILFYDYKGLSIGDFFLVQGIFSLTVFILEVPSGYIGDLFSRKKVLIMGTIIWLFGYLIWIFKQGFYAILTGEIFFAIANSFISGTLEAYLYDLLKKRHKEGRFHQKYAKMKTLGNLSLTFATFTGAFIYQIFGPTTPLWISVLLLIFNIIILALLPDVPESKRIIADNKSNWQDILDISKFALKHQEIRWLMIFPALYGALTLVLMWGVQSVMIVKEFPSFVFSLIMGGNALMRTFWAAVSGKILEKIKFSGIVKLACIILVIACIGACYADYVSKEVTYFCLFLMIIGSSSIVLSNISTSVLINHRIKSDERATVLSVNSMIDRLFWSFSMIALKPLFDNIGVGLTFIISSVLLIPILLCARYLYKMKLNTMGKLSYK